jgi:peptidoglycan/xylan/chitin deacetylase (PgdA/CDA1 family)
VKNLKKIFFRFVISFILFIAMIFIFPRGQIAVKKQSAKSNTHSKLINNNNKNSNNKIRLAEVNYKEPKYTPINPSAIKIPVLLYHHLKTNLGAMSPTSVITPRRFEEHLKALSQNGFHFIDFNQLYNFCKKNSPLPPHPFLITFDNGYLSNYELAYPILKKYNMKASIFVVTNWASKSPKAFPHFTWSQAKEMENSGLIYIGNHTCSHVDCKTISSRQLIAEVSNAENAIKTNLGNRKIKVFAYPAYTDTETSRQLLKSMGYKIQLTKLNGIVTKGTELSNVKRLLMSNDYSGQTVVNIINWWYKRP